MTNGERAEAFLRPILDEGGGSGDKELDDDTVTELEMQFDAVRKEALDEILEWINDNAESPPEAAATICLGARAEFEKRWGLR
jgi:hypothetical protein